MPSRESDIEAEPPVSSILGSASRAARRGANVDAVSSKASPTLMLDASKSPGRDFPGSNFTSLKKTDNASKASAASALNSSTRRQPRFPEDNMQSHRSAIQDDAEVGGGPRKDSARQSDAGSTQWLSSFQNIPVLSTASAMLGSTASESTCMWYMYTCT
jgi:hypothetical protein